jgi:hypothetical protein
MAPAPAPTIKRLFFLKSYWLGKILYDFNLEPEPSTKISAPAPAKCCGSISNTSFFKFDQRILLFSKNYD